VAKEAEQFGSKNRGSIRNKCYSGAFRHFQREKHTESVPEQQCFNLFRAMQKPL
jgi:hypothetical protein